MQSIRVLTIMLTVTLLLTGLAWTEDSAKHPQATCPVLGNKINKEFYSDFEEKRVYFCCASCISEFKKDPAKYIKKLEDQGVVLEKATAEKKKPDAASPGGQ